MTKAFDPNPLETSKLLLFARDFSYLETQLSPEIKRKIIPWLFSRCSSGFVLGPRQHSVALTNLQNTPMFDLNWS